MIITLEQLYTLLNNSYAVDVSGDLYFVSKNDDGIPYISTADEEADVYDIIEFSSIDGDIIIDKDRVRFTLNLMDLSLRFLTTLNPADNLS